MRHLKCLVMTLLIVCFAVTAGADDRRTDKRFLRVATFNAEFLWDGVPPEEGQVVAKNHEEAQVHMAGIATILKGINADIVNLVEVENIMALTMFSAGHLDNMNYVPLLKKGRDTYTGQDVAMLTRIDPKEPLDRFDGKGVSGSVQKNVSKNYYAIFEEGDFKFAIIGMHFLSGPDRKDRIHKRQAQAASMAYLATKLMGHGYEVIMMGDFNDYDYDVPDVAGNMPITRVLEICKLETDDNPDNDLVNVAEYVVPDKRFTAHYDKDRGNDVDGVRELSMIDHILVSKKLAAMIESVDIVHKHDPTKVSDHFPVVVTFRTSE